MNSYNYATRSYCVNIWLIIIIIYLIAHYCYSTNWMLRLYRAVRLSNLCWLGRIEVRWKWNQSSRFKMHQN